MADRRMAHTFDCSAEDYWDKLFFDDEYNRELFLGRLRFEHWQVVSQEQDDKKIRRVIDAVPPMPDLPSVLKKVVKDGLGYRETGVFDRATRRYQLSVVTKSLPGKVDVTGVTTTQSVGDKRCSRVHLAHAQANVRLVGGMIEARLLDDMEKSYAKAAEFSNRWIEQRGL